MQYAVNKAAIDRAIDTMIPVDPVSYKPALTAAYNALQHTYAEIKHIILLGDSDAEDSYTALATQIHKPGIPIWTVVTAAGPLASLLLCGDGAVAPGGLITAWFEGAATEGHRVRPRRRKGATASPCILTPPPYQPQDARSIHFRIKSLCTSYHHHVYLFLMTVLLATHVLRFLQKGHLSLHRRRVRQHAAGPVVDVRRARDATNIGAVVRGMGNVGLTRLVEPAAYAAGIRI